ncbi:uncharacterized protein LOC144440247 [Glandiceps talaboti]
MEHIAKVIIMLLGCISLIDAANTTCYECSWDSSGMIGKNDNCKKVTNETTTAVCENEADFCEISVVYVAYKPNYVTRKCSSSCSPNKSIYFGTGEETKCCQGNKCNIQDGVGVVTSSIILVTMAACYAIAIMYQLH